MKKYKTFKDTLMTRFVSSIGTKVKLQEKKD